MMKFASFENIVAAMYSYLPGTKDDYGKGAQTAVAFTSGYLAGILCAIVSHPADVMVSKLNADRQAGEGFGAAMSRIYGKIGFGGLWNGLPVRIVSLGTAKKRRNRLTYLLGHDWYPDWSAMDDLRLLQDLHGSSDNWWWCKGYTEAREGCYLELQYPREGAKVQYCSLESVYKAGLYTSTSSTLILGQIITCFCHSVFHYDRSRGIISWKGH